MSVSIQSFPEPPHTLAFTRNVGPTTSRVAVLAPGLLQICTKPNQPKAKPPPTKSRKLKNAAAQSLLAVRVPTKPATRNLFAFSTNTTPTPSSSPLSSPQSSPTQRKRLPASIVNKLDAAVADVPPKRQARQLSRPKASAPVVHTIPAYSHSSWAVVDDMSDDEDEDVVPVPAPVAVAFPFAQQPFRRPPASSAAMTATPVRQAPVRRVCLPEMTLLAPELSEPVNTRSAPPSPAHQRALAATASSSVPTTKTHAFKFADSARFTSPEKLKIKTPMQVFDL